RKPNDSPSAARRREHERGVGEDECLRPVPRPDDLRLFGKVEELFQSAPILANGIDRRAAAAVALKDDRPRTPSVPAAPRCEGRKKGRSRAAGTHHGRHSRTRRSLRYSLDEAGIPAAPTHVPPGPSARRTGKRTPILRTSLPRCRWLSHTRFTASDERREAPRREDTRPAENLECL